MHPSALFIRRPIATSLLMAAIALFGVVAYRALPVSDLPNVDFPTLVVSAGLSGADPGTMASAVATPLERQFTMIEGLDEMTSSSSMGGSQVTLQFALSRDIDSAAVDVQTGIAEVMPLLPPGMPSPPSFRKYNPADSPVMFLGLTSSTVPMPVLDDFAENLIARGSRWLPASRRSTSGAPRSMPSVCAWIRTSCERSASASTRCATRCRTGMSTFRPVRCSPLTRATASARAGS